MNGMTAPPSQGMTAPRGNREGREEGRPLPGDTLRGKVDLSLVVPCFNEEEVLPLFYEETSRVLAQLEEEGISGEFVFVDDGSTDATALVLENLRLRDSRVHYIVFSRNFGKESAMLAGLEEARGAFIALLDADLQHPPDLIPPMLEAVRSGEYDCTAARRTRTGDSPLRSFFARQFYKVMSSLSGMEMVDGAGDFRHMSRQYVEAILSLPERSRFSKGIFPWIGFRIKWIEYENVPRAAGKTKWSLRGLFLYSLDGITSFSSILLTFASVAGILSFIVSIFLFIFFVVLKFIGGFPVDGVATLACLVTFFGAVILLAIGILGQYLAKIYTEVKRRPPYLIQKRGGDPESMLNLQDERN